MVMKRKLFIQKDGQQYALDVYPLLVGPVDGDSDIRPWYERIDDIQMKVDEPAAISAVEPLFQRDFVFKHTDDQHYIIAHQDSENFQRDVDLALHSMNGETRGKIARVNPSYFRRYVARNNLVIEKKPVVNVVDANDGIRQIDPHLRNYKLGSWVTGAPAVAATMTFTPEVMAKTGLETAVTKPALLSTLLFAPVSAALLAFSMNYAANWVAYRLENKGRPLDKDARELIWKDSLLKSAQMGTSFFMLKGVRAVLEHALGESLGKAWGGVHALGGNICPSEVRAAVMLSMSLTFGIAMGVMSLMFNLWDKKVETKDCFKRAGAAFVTGLFAGAVASVDFGNSGLSFLATWAALNLVPTVKLTTHDGRAQVKESASNMGTSAKAMLKYAGKCMPSCSMEDFEGFNDPAFRQTLGY